MDQKALALLIGVALLCTATAMPGHTMTDCCIDVSSDITRGLLSHVDCFETQDNRFCNIKAVILHIGSQKLCANPVNNQLKRWMLRKKSQKQCQTRS